MATKDIKRLEDFIRNLDLKFKELDKEALAGYNELRRNAAEGKAWLQGQIDINDKSIRTINNDIYKISQRVSALEQEVGRIKRRQFSFTTYFTRIWAALRNKQ